jgi:hypothetical protein
MFAKVKAKSHINSCKGRDYSPIKEAENEGHQPGEDSKDSSLNKIRKSKVEESPSSYSSDTESKSLKSSAKGKKRSGRKKENETESSVSQSVDPTS